MDVPDYGLPEEAIAQQPIEPRDAARLLVALDPAGAVEHREVRDLPSLLGPGDVLVLNTSRVLPARLRLTKETGGAAEVLLLEPDGEPGEWVALVRPGRRLPPGTVLAATAGGPPLVEVGDRLEDGRRRVRLLSDVDKVVEASGTVALPPYIHEPLADPERYQTVYAEEPGSVAAPTAGLHLTHETLQRCRDAGAEIATVDLAVGLATFRPVTEARAEDHIMHTERYRVPPATMDACRRADRVVAVGTTTVRALETAAATGELSGESRLFIRGDYAFAVVDVLMTNYHLPRSTLLLLLDAFCGRRWRDLYAEALAQGYRFLSFGDAMIVGRTAATCAVKPARFELIAADGEARAGLVHTARGSFTTPCFMPVGTRGAVRLLDAGDLDGLSPQVVLANTYHLMLRPGAAVVEELGGLHRFTGWDGHLLTDSGGYQVFSLAPKIDDDGATFRSTYDGSLHRLTPEDAVRLQEQLGADIQMTLDICTGWPASDEEVHLAAKRTLAWAVRARGAHRRSDQCLFGIVQGGVDAALRTECAADIAALEFDGYGIGGLSVGEPRELMLPALEAVTAVLPIDRPRYLMGVGDPVSMLHAVARGVDMFDCVLPTRLARHGTALTSAGRYQVRVARNATDDGPLDRTCPCRVCTRFSRGYIRHLLMSGELTGGRLLSIHNLAWLLGLVDQARQAIQSGRLTQLRAEVGAIWERGPLR